MKSEIRKVDFLKTNLVSSQAMERPIQSNSKSILAPSIPQSVIVEEETQNYIVNKGLASKLMEMHAKYRMLLENSYDLIFQIDLKGNFRDVNSKMLELLGYEREKFLASSIMSFLSEGQKQLTSKMIDEVKSGHIQKHVDELKLKKKGGSYIEVDYVAMAIFRNDEPYSIIYIARDISETKKLKEMLEKSEQKFDTLAEASPDMIFIATEDRLIYINKTAENIVGYTLDELLSPNFKLIDIVAPEYRQKAKKIFQTLLFKGEYPSHEMVFLHRNNKKVNTSVKLKLTKYGDSKAVLGIVTDTSALISAQRAQLESAAKLIKAITSIVDVVASTMELRDPYTFTHQQRVTELAVAIATEMNLPEDNIEGIRLGAMVHDIGKIYVPAQILSKPPPLNKLEFDLIKMHPRTGYDILKKIDFPWPIPEIALQHHERINGSGYPNGISKEKIIQEARIVAVADVVEAMSSHRPYRPSLGIDSALVEISQNKGILYDADAVDACLRLFYEKNFKFD